MPTLRDRSNVCYEEVPIATPKLGDKDTKELNNVMDKNRVEKSLTSVFKEELSDESSDNSNSSGSEELVENSKPHSSNITNLINISKKSKHSKKGKLSSRDGIHHQKKKRKNNEEDTNKHTKKTKTATITNAATATTTTTATASTATSTATTTTATSTSLMGTLFGGGTTTTTTTATTDDIVAKKDTSNNNIHKEKIVKNKGKGEKKKTATNHEKKRPTALTTSTTTTTSATVINDSTSTTAATTAVATNDYTKKVLADVEKIIVNTSNNTTTTAATTTSGSKGFHGNVIQSAEYKDLEKKYSRLLQLRETDAEKIVKNIKARTLKQETIQNELNKNMQHKINNLKSQIVEAKQLEAITIATAAASATMAVTTASATSAVTSVTTVREPAVVDVKQSEEYKEALEKIKTYKMKLAHVTKKLEVTQKEKKALLESLEHLDTEAAASINSKTTGKPLNDNSNDNDSKDYAGLLRVFEMLTSVSIHEIGLSEQAGIVKKYQCEVTNDTLKKVVRFTLDFGTSERCAEVEYRPNGNSNLLPSFLQQPVTFELSQAPLFLTKVLDAIHADVDE